MNQTTRSALAICIAALLMPLAPLQAAELLLVEPLDYQVIQRTSSKAGVLRLRGTIAMANAAEPVIETRVTVDDTPGAWERLPVQFEGVSFTGTMKAAAGGWFRLEARVLQDGSVVGASGVEHVGIGEVFVVAGQSNSANHGEEKQITQTKRVAAFDGRKWQVADDPQPGASGGGGSFMPPLGDELVRQLNVPVGFIACGVGATSVREWLPRGTTFPNPPTLEGNVVQLPGGDWVSKGELYSMFVARMKSAGTHGFRAVLWHQGESDANQTAPARTLPGRLHREYLAHIILASRKEIGWNVPWFVAQVSYHVPGDEASPDIRNAQAALWKEHIALEGPDSDALKGRLREQDGQGVHFSGEGLLVHAAKWAEKIVPWLAAELNSTGEPTRRGTSAGR